jgi:hypothetical protein
MRKHKNKPGSPPSVAELREKIEKWAPERHHEERRWLYADLHADGIAFEVLLAAQIAHGFRDEESPRLEWQKDYWRQREAIEKQIQNIRSHPLVLNLEDPIFRELGPHCPHGRGRLECEEIYSLLSICRGPLGWPRAPKKAVEAAFEKRERALKDLVGYNLGPPEKLNPDDFCKSPMLPEPSQQWDEPAAGKVGRPRAPRMSVLEKVMAALKRCRLSQRRKLEYVERVLRYCFDDENADADELAARWREIKRETKPKPDASGSFLFE